MSRYLLHDDWRRVQAGSTSVHGFELQAADYVAGNDEQALTIHSHTFFYPTILSSPPSCFMSKQGPLNKSHKRQRTEEHSLCAKRQKFDGLSADRYPPSLFWDGLSKIWLTRDALRELDRRNSNPVAQSTPRPVRPPDRPVTRNFLTELRNRCQRKQTADEFLHDCTPESLKTVKRFARHGGFDLSDLKGVCILVCSRMSCVHADVAVSSTRSPRVLPLNRR
jgi:hypothetical protein